MPSLAEINQTKNFFLPTACNIHTDILWNDRFKLYWRLFKLTKLDQSVLLSVQGHWKCQLSLKTLKLKNWNCQDNYFEREREREYIHRQTVSSSLLLCVKLMLPINSKKKLRKCLFYVNIDISKHVFLLMQMPQEEKKQDLESFFFLDCVM